MVEQKGKWHGRGKLTRPNGSVYEGDYVMGEMTGEGRYSFPNGDAYEGHFLKGKFEGKGRYTFASGDPPLEGTFRDGKPVGELSSA